MFAKRHPKRNSLPNKWSIPSEKIGIGESKIEAVKRCGKEELNVNNSWRRTS